MLLVKLTVRLDDQSIDGTYGLMEKISMRNFLTFSSSYVEDFCTRHQNLKPLRPCRVCSSAVVSESFDVHYNVGRKCKSRHGTGVSEDG